MLKQNLFLFTEYMKDIWIIFHQFRVINRVVRREMQIRPINPGYLHKVSLANDPIYLKYIFLLVNPQLRTANEHIWAAGDVCQIWSPEENHYRFYYGWKNVKMMGRIAAVNMTGGNEAVSTFKEDKLMINNQGELDSTLWEYD